MVNRNLNSPSPSSAHQHWRGRIHPVTTAVSNAPPARRTRQEQQDDEADVAFLCEQHRSAERARALVPLCVGRASISSPRCRRPLLQVPTCSGRSRSGNGPRSSTPFATRTSIVDAAGVPWTSTSGCRRCCRPFLCAMGLGRTDEILTVLAGRFVGGDPVDLIEEHSDSARGAARDARGRAVAASHPGAAADAGARP